LAASFLVTTRLPLHRKRSCPKYSTFRGTTSIILQLKGPRLAISKPGSVQFGNLPALESTTFDLHQIAFFAFLDDPDDEASSNLETLKLSVRRALTSLPPCARCLISRSARTRRELMPSERLAGDISNSHVCQTKPSPTGSTPADQPPQRLRARPTTGPHEQTGRRLRSVKPLMLVLTFLWRRLCSCC
jgi:hypothetical protein